MTELLVKEEASIHLPSVELSDEEFFDLCVQNPEYRIERTAAGQIIVMSGTGGKTGNRNARIGAQLVLWADKDKRGIAFDSSTMFLLPNTAMRSPDAAWVPRSRLEALSERDKERYLPLCPDFVVELTSHTDRLPQVKEKMAEWMANGCRLGWIIHPKSKEVHIYRPAGVEIVRGATEIRGDPPAEGFVLDLSTIWEPGW